MELLVLWISSANESVCVSMPAGGMKDDEQSICNQMGKCVDDVLIKTQTFEGYSLVHI